MPQCLQRMSKFSKLACNSSLLLAEEYTPTYWLQPLHMVYNRIAFFSKVNSLRQTYSEKNIKVYIILSLQPARPGSSLTGKLAIAFLKQILFCSSGKQNDS